ncbi:MAG: archease [Salinibacter sp.]
MTLSRTPSWLQQIDHTGDLGLRVTADTLPRLFERAAEGTFRVLTDLGDVRPAVASTVTVRAPDREALVVRWLSELNFRHAAHRRLYGAFAVSSVEAQGDEWVLEATVRGEPIDPERHVVHTEIKAVTFHGLEVQETEAGWTVQVIFDL